MESSSEKPEQTTHDDVIEKVDDLSKESGLPRLDINKEEPTKVIEPKEEKPWVCVYPVSMMRPRGMIVHSASTLNNTRVLEHENKLCIRALLRFAGKDISDWFDEKTGDIAYHIHPVSGCRVPYLPHGPIPDIEHLVPATSWKPICGLPWWKDPKYQIGLLTKRVRQIKVINFDLTYVVTMTVCSEDTILRIKERYSIYNSSANQYIWKCNDRVLDDNLTLEENGIPNEQDKLVCIGLPASLGIPAIFIHYCDDFSRYRADSDESDDLKLL